MEKKQNMTSRERVTAACNFQEPDKVPIGLGATRSTTFHVDAYADLVRELGYDLEPVKAFDAAMMKAHIDMEMVQYLQADVIQLESVVNCLGIPNEDWKEFTTNLGHRILVPGQFTPTRDTEGSWVFYDKDGSEISRMSRDGYFFDSVIPTAMTEELELHDPAEWVGSLPMLKEKHMARLEKRAKLFYENTEYALHGNFIMHDLFGFDTGGHTYSDWMVLMLTERDYCAEVLERMTDWTIENLKMYLDANGKYLHSILVSTADFGGQKCELFSPEVFNELYVPCFKRISDFIHKTSDVKVMIHCCGSVPNFIPLFIKAGIDILNPIQTQADNMDPVALKEKFGGKIVFWGGGMDTQHVLNYGSEEEIREHVHEHMKTFGKGGGYVFTPNHNILPDSPAKKVIAMMDAVKEFRNYPLR